MDLHGFTATKIQQRSKGAKYWNKMKQDHAHPKACATDMHRSPKFEWHEALQLVWNTKNPGAMKNSMPLSVNLSLYSSLSLENVPSSADFCPFKKCLSSTNHKGTLVNVINVDAPWFQLSSIWVCLKIGYIPNEIAIFHRDNDQQNHWV